MRSKLSFHPELIVFDFDGVFTDNRVYVSEDGSESVMCNRGDGLAIDFLRNKFPLIIFSSETNKVVARRSEKLGIDVRQGLKDKKKALIDLCKTKGINPKKVVFIGNDINDIGLIKTCGYSLCPRDAHPEVLKEVDYVLKKRGGEGVIGEFCEVFLGM